MDPQRIEGIFWGAARIGSPEEREAFLNRACAGDAEVRRRVEQLLQARSKAEGFLEAPAANLVATLDEPPLGEAPGTVVGPYKLLEQLGEGGFGVVFLAEQQEPVRRQVALKVLKPGMDTRQVVARFEAERQALALMDHPNIAKVLDGGATASGRPYFVMELVRGVPITEHCDQNRLGARERLELFASVCQAVQHAHQKGVIHRDLKPSNVLVTLYDGTPVPKVIDFGIAKATKQRLTERTLFTNFAQMVGTPLYMSPEQAEMNGLDVDTRSDVYALGVLLYELLTGTTPFESETLRRAGLDEMRRIIREEEPPRPSHRVTTLGAGASATVSERRGVDGRRLSQLLRGELDWIVMKALEKDRNRRYESASALAADVQRYLHDEPVQACPPSAWYRLRKFVRRNKAALATGALTLLFLVLLGGGIGWAARGRAARQAETAAAVQAALEEAQGLRRQSKWREGEAAARRAEALLASGGGSAETRQRVHELLADLRMGARLEEVRLLGSDVKDGRFDLEAEDHGYAAAFRDYGIDVEALAPSAAAERIGARAIRVELAAALDGWARKRRAVPKEGGKSWQDLLAVARTADPDPWRTALRDAVLRGDRQALVERAASDEVRALPPVTRVLLAKYLAEMGGLKEATALLRRAQERYPGDFWINHALAFRLAHLSPPQWDEAIRFYTAAVALRPDSPGARLNLGVALGHKGRFEEAAAAARKAIELKPDYAEAYNNLGLVLAARGRLDEAIAACRQALELKPDLAEAYNNLGLALQRKGRLDEAVAAYRRAVELKPGHAGLHNNLGSALTDNGRLDEAVAACRQALELKCDYPQAYNNLGLALQRKGRLDEAVAACRRAIELKPDLPEAHFNLGLALAGQGRLDDALAAYRQAIALKPVYAEAHCNLGLTLKGKGRLDEALTAYRRAIELKPDLVTAHRNLGLALTDMGQLDEAVAAFRKVIVLKPDYPTAHYDLANTLLMKGRLDEAVAAFRRAIELKPDYAEAHCNLGYTLRRQGELTASLAAFRQGHRLGSRRQDWAYPSARWVREGQRLVELDGREAAVLRGEAKPADAAERKDHAQLCYSKKLYVASARLWADAFTADPNLADDLELSHRYEAACVAALAAAGQGADAGRLDDQGRARWRKQALDWLRADLVANGKLLASGKPEARPLVRQRLRHWQGDQQLAGLREPAAVARLPADERGACQQFWAEVQRLLSKADAAR
jgi:tetratricopeptide (TPR) repeat protein/serine/threonine protein kinase